MTSNLFTVGDVEHKRAILRAHDVSQLIQISRREEVVIAVAPLHIFIDPVEIETVRFQQFHLLRFIKIIVIVWLFRADAVPMFANVNLRNT